MTIVADDTTIEKVADSCVAMYGPAVGHFQGKVRDCPEGVSAIMGFDARNVDWGDQKPPGIDGNPDVDGPVNTFPWVGIEAPASPPPLPVPTPDSSSVCRKYLFIGARSSGEPAGDDESMGRFVHQVFVNVAADQPSIREIGLDYAARAVPLTDGQFPDIAAFLDSAWAGTYALVRALRQQADSCANEKVVLAGYSQGAWVIHAVLQYLEARDSPLLDNIAAVAFVADPLRSTRADPYITYVGTAKPENGGAGKSKGIARVGMPNALLSFHTWTAGLFESLIAPQGDIDNVPLSAGAFPDSTARNAISLCDAHDMVCGWSFDQENGSVPHGSYDDADLKTLSDFIGRRMK